MSIESSRTAIAKLAGAASGGIITLEAAIAVLGGSRLSVSRRLSSLVGAGWLSRVRRGVYSVRPLDAPPDVRTAEEDPWIVASRVFDPCYVGGWTAAGHWHLTEQLFRTTLVVTERHVRRAAVTIGSGAFRVVRESRNREMGLATVWRSNSRVRISNVDRTIIDACAHPDWVGGGGQLISIFKAGVQDSLMTAESLLAVAPAAPTGAALGRLALLLDRYWPAATTVIEYAAAHRGTGYVRFDPAVARRGALNTRWGVWQNISFENADS